jgi:hypothetical protein
MGRFATPAAWTKQPQVPAKHVGERQIKVRSARASPAFVSARDPDEAPAKTGNGRSTHPTLARMAPHVIPGALIAIGGIPDDGMKIDAARWRFRKANNAMLGRLFCFKGIFQYTNMIFESQVYRATGFRGASGQVSAVKVGGSE